MIDLLPEALSTMNCKNCEEMLSEFLDASLDDAQRLSLGLHLRECIPCDSLRIELTVIITLGRKLRSVQVVPPNADALWARLSQSLASHARGSSLPTSPLRKLYVENEA
ncbi:MAG TPA: hypothetical protein DCK93_19370 [Blastocatellia bacterium]|jgi:hypothetical protein|nr:hypothetical protein [Blastocatellia bacterium]